MKVEGAVALDLAWTIEYVDTAGDGPKLERRLVAGSGADARPAPMTPARRLRRVFLLAIWRLINPSARRLARFAPWWIVLETTGRRSGETRSTPLARGPLDAGSIWIVAVHGRHAQWVRNIDADPAVRIRIGRAWHRARASTMPLDDERLHEFSRYARLGPRLAGIDPLLVRVDLQELPGTRSDASFRRGAAPP